MRMSCLNNNTYAPSCALACAVMCPVCVYVNKLNIEDGVAGTKRFNWNLG